MKKVSIIIPVYNMEKHIETGVKYITEQTYENLEIIMIDDGSKDESYKKCLAEADKDNRIAVFSKNNEGPGAARNLALRKATGDYIYFFDIDDSIEKNTIEVLVNAMEKQETDLVACGFCLHDGKNILRTVEKEDGYKRSGDEARNDYYEQMFMYEKRGIQGAAWYKLYKTDIIRKNNIVFPPMRKYEDEIFVASYVSHIDSFCLVGDVLCKYYKNTHSRFWDKYRFDIFDTGRESTMYLLDIVYGWNKLNIEVRNKIYTDYYYKSFDSLFFLFNPKLKLKKQDRYTRIKEITDTFISDIPEDFSVDHAVFKAMKKKQYRKIYIRTLLSTLRHRFG